MPFQEGVLVIEERLGLKPSCIVAPRYVSSRSRTYRRGLVSYDLSNPCCVCMCVCTWWPPAQTHHQFVSSGQSVIGANFFWGLFVSGQFCFGDFVLGGFLTRRLLVRRRLSRGYLPGVFDLELPSHCEYSRHVFSGVARACDSVLKLSLLPC